MFVVTTKKTITTTLSKKIGLNGKQGERRSSINLRPIRGKIAHTAIPKDGNAETREGNSKRTRSSGNQVRVVVEKRKKKSDKKKKNHRRTTVTATLPASYRQANANEDPLSSSKEDDEDDDPISLKGVEIDTEREILDETSLREKAANVERMVAFEKKIDEECSECDGNDNIDNHHQEVGKRDNFSKKLSVAMPNDRVKISFYSALEKIDRAVLTLGKYVGDKTCGNASFEGDQMLGEGKHN